MSIFEIIMLVCFGAAWPCSIWRSYKSRTAAGKSGVFLFIVIIGYASGVIHKLLYSPDPVIILYAINALLVSIDIALYFRNRNLDKLKHRRSEDNS